MSGTFEDIYWGGIKRVSKQQQRSYFYERQSMWNFFPIVLDTAQCSAASFRPETDGFDWRTTCSNNSEGSASMPNRVSNSFKLV